MKSLAPGISHLVSVIRGWYVQRANTALFLACVIMAIIAALKLPDEFHRLLWEDRSTGGAIDLKYFFDWVSQWFKGETVSGGAGRGAYLPASFPILWLLVGWLPFEAARWCFAITVILALGALTYLIIRTSGADTWLERTFAVLMLFSMTATGVTIGNGQLILHLLPVLLIALLVLYGDSIGWHRDLLVAVLIIITLVKPSISAPFLWLVLLAPGGIRTAALAALGYMALTFFAVSFQPAGLQVLLSIPVEEGVALAATAGYGNVHFVLGYLGLRDWLIPASVVLFAALGIWVYRYRYGDVWLLLSVAALVARFWMYHRVYDDLLILVPQIALFRIAKRGVSEDGSDVIAGVLLALTTLLMLPPAQLRSIPRPWNLIHETARTISWGADFIFLVYYAWRTKGGIGIPTKSYSHASSQGHSQQLERF